MSNDPNGAVPARTAIDPAEYDFSGVPDNELVACLYYEYLRESEAIVREVSKAKEQLMAAIKRQNPKVGASISAKITLTKVTSHQEFMLEGAMITILAAASVFPTLPWQSLAPADKHRLRDFPDRANRMHNEDFAKRHPKLLLDIGLKDPTLGRSTLNAWKSKRTPKAYRKAPAPKLERVFASGFIQIHLGYSKEQLTEAFGDWLKANFPEVCVKAKERRGRHTERDPLNALGALRLRYHCRTLNEAQNLIAPLANTPQGMTYSDRTAWKRACDAAVDHFRWMLKLPDSHLPIHYTEGWQK